MIVYQPDAFNKAKAEPLTKEALLKLTTNPKVTHACAEIHDALESVKRGDMSRKDFEEVKKKLKKGLPILLAHGYPKDGIRHEKDDQGNPNMEPNGLAMADFDHLAEDPWQLYQDRIKGHEEQLGIVFSHVTPSREGLHVFFRRPAQGCILQAQLWMGKKVGVEVDRGCFDLARSAYLVPEDYILYLSDDLFSEKNEPLTLSDEDQALFSSLSEEAAAGNKQNKTSGEATLGGVAPYTNAPVGGDASERHQTQASFRGIPYASIISRYWQKTGGEPVEGERNVKLYQLAANLRAVCDNSPSLLMQVMPRYGLSESEMRSIIDSATKEPVKGSKIIKEIVNEEEREKRKEKSEHSSDSDFSADLNQENISLFSFLSPLFSKRLPAALRASLAGMPPHLHFPIMASVMPIAAALADGVEVEYCDGARQRLSLMSIVLGDQASGKSLCKQVVDLWKRSLEQDDLQARKTEDEWKQKKKNRKANERCPEDPQVMIRVLPVTVSCSTLLRRFKNSRGHTLYSFGEELDTLRKTNGAGSWSSKYDIYRLAFDHGEWGQDYNSDQAESGTVNVAYNWTMLGTYGAMRRCFKRDNVENGLSSRVMVAEMPDNSFAPMPHYGKRTALDEQKIQEGVMRLRSRTGFIDTPRLRKAIGEWVEEKRIEALSEIDRVKDTYRKRAAVIGFRCGVVCHLLSGDEKETKATLQFATAMAELTLQGQMRIFGDDLRAQLEEGSPKDTQRAGCNKSIFEQLPPVFTMDDLSQLKGNTCNRDSLRSVTMRWIKAGWIVKTDSRHWQKT